MESYDGIMLRKYIVELYYGDILRQIYYTADTLRQIYYGRYITADILRQIYYGNYITADTLWPIYCVPQKRPYLDTFPEPEALDCCVRTCLLQRIAPRTPLDRFIYKKSAGIKKCLRAHPMEKGVYP